MALLLTGGCGSNGYTHSFVVSGIPFLIYLFEIYNGPLISQVSVNQLLSSMSANRTCLIDRRNKTSTVLYFFTMVHSFTNRAMFTDAMVGYLTLDSPVLTSYKATS